MTRLALYFNTLRHLRPVQLRYQLTNRLRRRSSPLWVVRETSIAQRDLAPVSHLPHASGAVSADLEFQFLNARLAMQDGRVDWAPSSVSKLWRYNLHYFDYLLDPQLADQTKAKLIDDWIRDNPVGTPDAWEPYPVSLRIVNWVKYFSQPGRREALPTHWLESLFLQAAWLEDRFEYHLLANHLFKNTVALLFAGAFFTGPTGDRWLRRGWESFIEEAREQFLPDGGHYERSPMYHAISLEDCLDVLTILRDPSVVAHVPNDSTLTDLTCRATGFLADVCFPDGQIALFNDAAFGIAPHPEVLLAHARHVLAETLVPSDAASDGPRLHPEAGLDPGRSESNTGASGCQLIDKRDSGYFGFRHGRDMLLVDCGPVGPDYQPGHAHCDTLSYELAFNGRRVIVDSGVHDYESGQRRALCRTTAGHNTVRVDGQEQSEIWGAFRVARRARPLFASIERSGPGCTFEGAHDGYKRLPGAPVHRRRIQYDGVGVIEVRDELEGSGEHVAESRVRLHPDFRVKASGPSAQVLGRDGVLIARIESTPPLGWHVERGRYFPRFGVELECDVLVLRVSGSLPQRFGYRIRKVASS